MRKKLLTFLLLTLPALLLCAQTRKVQNRPYTDYRRLHYGFFFGMHTQDLKFDHGGYVTDTGEMWYADVASYTPAFSVGVLADLRINNHVALRLVPSMHFGEKQITFKEQNGGESDKQIVKSTYISVPLDVKLSAQRFNNYRPYVLAGINPMYDLTGKRQKQLLFQKFDLFWEVGLGCDFYLPFFKLIPELKFCFSLMNILDKDRSDLIDKSYLKFTESVDGAQARMVVLSFYFE